MILIRFASIPSTQDWARRWAQLGAPEILVVQAQQQTAGRGRLRRSWWSPPGTGLYLSLLVRPALPLSRTSQLTMLTAVAAMTACQEVAGIRPRPKWPNDLLWQGRKLAGILTEIEQERGWLRYAIIGLGLNVNTSFRGTALEATAISLSEACGRPLAVTAVRDSFLAHFQEQYRRFQAGESPFPVWQRDLEPLGRRVRVRMTDSADNEGLVGLAIGVNPQGALLVQDDAGGLHTVWAGDVDAEATV
jgi:BirA family biotin operon repressor/biotin-[acetyl-CoA-carboxylase] ligase